MLYAQSMYKRDVLKHFKTSTAVAKALGISVAAVSQWGELIPPLSARRIADKTPELHFDPALYRRSSLEIRQTAQALAY